MKLTKKQAALLDRKSGYLVQIANCNSRAALKALHPELRVFCTWYPEFRREIVTAYYDRASLIKLAQEGGTNDAKV